MRTKVAALVVVVALCLLAPALGGSSQGNQDFHGYVIVSDLEDTSKVWVEKKLFKSSWFTPVGDDGGKLSDEKFEMQLEGQGDDAHEIEYTQYDGEAKVYVNHVYLNPDAQAAGDKHPDRVHMDLTTLKTATGNNDQDEFYRRLLRLSAWWWVHTIEDTMKAYLPDHAFTDEKYILKWMDADYDSVASASMGAEKSFTVGIVPDSGGVHALADSEVLNHEFNHFYTKYGWRPYYKHSKDGQEAAVQEGMSDVATLIIRSLVLNDVDLTGDFAWAVGAHLNGPHDPGLATPAEQDASRYMRKYFPSKTRDERMTLAGLGNNRDNLMVQHLTFGEYVERGETALTDLFSAHGFRVKNFYSRGMILSSAVFETLVRIARAKMSADPDESDRKKALSKASKKVYKAMYHALPHVMAPLRETVAGNNLADEFNKPALMNVIVEYNGALKDNGYDPDHVAVTALDGAMYAKRFAVPHVFIKYRNCFIKYLADPSITKGKSNRKEWMLLAWNAFAAHGLGVNAKVEVGLKSRAEWTLQESKNRGTKRYTMWKLKDPKDWEYHEDVEPLASVDDVPEASSLECGVEMPGAAEMELSEGLAEFGEAFSKEQAEDQDESLQPSVDALRGLLKSERSS